MIAGTVVCWDVLLLFARLVRIDSETWLNERSASLACPFLHAAFVSPIAVTISLTACRHKSLCACPSAVQSIVNFG